jgi:hypothetical protein
MKKITKIIPVILSVLLIIACNKSITTPASNQSTSSNCYNTSPLLRDVLWCSDDINDSILIKFCSDGNLFADGGDTWAPVVTNCNNIIIYDRGFSQSVKINSLTSDSMKLISYNDTIAFHKIDILGNPVKIGNIEVAQFDFPRSSVYHGGRILGEGWRLPSVSELNTMYLNKNKIGNFKNYYYLTTGTFIDRGVTWKIKQNFSNGKLDTTGYSPRPFVRAVRSL